MSENHLNVILNNGSLFVHLTFLLFNSSSVVCLSFCLFYSCLYQLNLSASLKEACNKCRNITHDFILQFMKKQVDFLF